MKHDFSLNILYLSIVYCLYQKRFIHSKTCICIGQYKINVIHTHKELNNIRSCIFFHILQPTVEVIEGFHLSQIISDYYTIGTSVVALRDSTESLLTSSIPYLQLEV